MIRLENINKTFNKNTPNAVHLIRDLNFHVAPGDFVTIIGSNGAGKTTLFNLISGNIMPCSGRISMKGKDISRQPEFKRAQTMGRIFQDPLLGTASNMTLEDNMMITHRKGFKWLKLSLNRKMREFFRRELVLLDMGLEDRMKENISLLSGGQRQALTLLMTVLSNPDLILLDEHTAALDPRNAAKVMELTLTFINQYNLTAMMITHNMNHAIQYGNRLIMMDAGEIIIDLKGEEKKNLTPARLVEMFSDIRKKDLENDEMRLGL